MIWTHLVLLAAVSTLPTLDAYRSSRYPSRKYPLKAQKTSRRHHGSHVDRLPANYFRPFPQYLVTEKPEGLWFDPNFIDNHRWKDTRPRELKKPKYPFTSGDFNRLISSDPDYGYNEVETPDQLSRRNGLLYEDDYYPKSDPKQDIDPYASVLGPLGLLSVVVAGVSAVYLLTTTDTSSLTQAITGRIQDLGLDDVFDMFEQSQSLVRRLSTDQVDEKEVKERETTDESIKQHKRMKRAADARLPLSHYSKKHDKVLDYLTDILYTRMNKRVNQITPIRHHNKIKHRFRNQPIHNRHSPKRYKKESQYYEDLKTYQHAPPESKSLPSSSVPSSSSFQQEFVPSPIVKSTEDEFSPILDFPTNKWPLEIFQQKPPSLEGNFRPMNLTGFKSTHKKRHTDYFKEDEGIIMDSSSKALPPYHSGGHGKRYRGVSPPETFGDFEVSQTLSVSSHGPQNQRNPHSLHSSQIIPWEDTIGSQYPHSSRNSFHGYRSNPSRRPIKYSIGDLVVGRQERKLEPPSYSLFAKSTIPKKTSYTSNDFQPIFPKHYPDNSIGKGYDQDILYAFNVLLSALKLDAGNSGSDFIQEIPFVTNDIPRDVYAKISNFMTTYFNSEKFEVWKEIESLIKNIGGSKEDSAYFPNHKNSYSKLNHHHPNWADVFHLVLNGSR